MPDPTPQGTVAPAFPGAMVEGAVQRTPWWISVASLAGAVAFGLWYALAYRYRFFAPYDDEGYLLVSLRHFLAGKPLYTDTYSQYGPVYYYVQQAALALLGLPLTHDSGRLLMLIYWLGTAGASGLLLWRVSRSVPLGGSAFLAVLGTLAVLAREPGHPQELTVVFTVAGAWAAWAAGQPRWQMVGLFGLGASGAALALIKINIGAFFILGVLSALLFFLPLGAWYRWAVGSWSMLMVAVPVLLMWPHLGAAWARNYCALMTCSLFIAALSSVRLPLPAPLPLRSLWPVLAGVLAVAVPILCLARLQGTLAADLLDGIVLAPTRHPKVFFVPFHLRSYRVALSVLWLLLAGRFFLHERGRTLLPWLRAALPLVGFGTVILTLLTPEFGIAIAAPLLFMLVVPRPGGWQAAELLPRYALCWLTLLEFLQAFPVAASQVATAAHLLLIWACWCIADGWPDLQALLARRFPAAGHWVRVALSPAAFGTVLTLTGALLLAKLNPAPPGEHMLSFRLPGTETIWTYPSVVAKERWLAATLAARCDTVFGMPGMGKYNMWTGLPTPDGLFMGQWMTAFTAAQQQQVVHDLQSFQRPCLTYAPAITAFWMPAGPGPLATSPLAQYILHQTQPVAEAGGTQIRVPLARVAEWPGDLLTMREMDLHGTELAIPEGLLRGAPDYTFRFWLKQSGHGLRVRTTSGNAARLPDLVIQGGGAALGTVAATNAPSTRRLDDGGWHHFLLRSRQGNCELLLDGRITGAGTPCAASLESPYYGLRGEAVIGPTLVLRRAWSEAETAADIKRGPASGPPVP